MQIFGKEINIRYFLYTRGLPALIIVDLFLISIALIFEIPDDVMWNIQVFDLIVCIILLGEYFLNLFLSGSKKLYIFDKENCFSHRLSDNMVHPLSSMTLNIP